MSGLRLLVARALVLGPWRDHYGRTALAVTAIALGVALGLAVHLINASALNEFEAAARHLAGTADLVVRGPRDGFDEALYARIARLPQVATANPAVEAEAPVAGRQESLHIVGFDPLRAAELQPDLVPARSGMVSELFDPRAIALSPAAAGWLGLRPGDFLDIVVGTGTVTLRVAGLLPEGAYRQRLGVMDIASAQLTLARLGRINRIDLRVRAGTDVAAFRRSLQAMLPAGVHAAPAASESRQDAALTRAYRLNLDMLALVALFTGAFLVFSSQVLSLLRRRTHLALLRTLGLPRGTLAAWLLAEGAVVGLAGAACGIAAGYALAHYALQYVGADLGAGYFRGVAASLRPDGATLARFLALGLAFSLLGTAAPVLEAARRPPARALRAGDEEDALAPLRTPWHGAACAAAGLALTQAPAVDGLPLAGYSSIALLLLGAVLLMPWLAAHFLARLPQPAAAAAGIAVARLKATPRQAAIGIAAIVTSVSLMAAMLIMVGSFRTSLESWLGRMLPADLYLRSARFGETGFLAPEIQARVAGTPGLARVEFLRVQKLSIDPGRPPVTLLAGPARAGRDLPVAGPTALPDPAGLPPIWVSEIAADLYRWRVGDTIRLPLAGTPHAFTVAGIWRDYARQGGAVAIDRALYTTLTGDHLANDAAIWLAPGVSRARAERDLRDRLPAASTVEIAAASEIRERSLALFDRTFAITYALEIAAILIGLGGVAVSFGAQVLARRREFGVLRHLGMARREIGALLALEGGLAAGMGVLAGLGLGWVVGLILVHVVNRQSFHWSMEVHVPWLQLAALGCVIVAAAVATAVFSGRAAMQDDVVRAVREDW